MFYFFIWHTVTESLYGTTMIFMKVMTSWRVVWSSSSVLFSSRQTVWNLTVQNNSGKILKQKNVFHLIFLMNYLINCNNSDYFCWVYIFEGKSLKCLIWLHLPQNYTISHLINVLLKEVLHSWKKLYFRFQIEKYIPFVFWIATLISQCCCKNVCDTT